MENYVVDADPQELKDAARSLMASYQKMADETDKIAAAWTDLGDDFKDESTSAIQSSLLAVFKELRVSILKGQDVVNLLNNYADMLEKA